MFPIESFKNSLLKFVKILSHQKIPFHLTGGITGVAYGEPRLTQDIDIVIENAASVEQIETLIVELTNSDFVFTEATVRDAISNKGMFQLFDSIESLKLDIYPREMIEGELSRSQEVEIFESVSLPIASRIDAAGIHGDDCSDGAGGNRVGVVHRKQTDSVARLEIALGFHQLRTPLVSSSSAATSDS